VTPDPSPRRAEPRLAQRCNENPGPARGRCPACAREYERNKSARRRVRNTSAWQRARAEARRRDGERCQSCGATEQLEVHHIVPLAAGGEQFGLSNLTTLCVDCHPGGRGAIETREPSHPSPSAREKHWRKIGGLRLQSNPTIRWSHERGLPLLRLSDCLFRQRTASDLLRVHPAAVRRCGMARGLVRGEPRPA
jgi:5-methylcytosine-specific restriction enzyme A